MGSFWSRIGAWVVAFVIGAFYGVAGTVAQGFRLGWFPLGLVLALGAGQFLASLLFQTEAYDAGIVIAAVLAIATIAIGAGMMPAIRASRIDPMKALRYE